MRLPIAQKRRKITRIMTSSFLALAPSGQVSPRALLGERFSQVLDVLTFCTSVIWLFRMYQLAKI